MPRLTYFIKVSFARRRGQDLVKTLHEVAGLVEAHLEYRSKSVKCACNNLYKLDRSLCSPEKEIPDIRKRQFPRLHDRLEVDNSNVHLFGHIEIVLCGRTEGSRFLLELPHPFGEDIDQTDGLR